MALWTIALTQNGQVLQIPVVSIGASPLPSKIRLYKAGLGYGELPLVYPDDNRASKLRVRQGGVTYAIAADERTSIRHDDDFVVSQRNGDRSDYTTTLLFAWRVGATYFNRVTRIEAYLLVGANAACNTWSLISPYHNAAVTARLRVANGARTYYTGGVSSFSGGNHPVASSVWQSGWVYNSGLVAVDVEPGRYDVHLELIIQASGTDHNFWAEGSATLDYWTEIARG